jgi:hypothetical protein
MMIKAIPVLFLLFAAAAFAETTGTINFTYVNATTGLFGYTIEGCNSDADCHGYKCFLDFDGTSNSSGFGGWCNTTSVTNCFHSAAGSPSIYAFASGDKLCIANGTAGNNTYRTCSGGVWSSITACASGYTCAPSDIVAATCASSSSGGGPGSGGGVGSSSVGAISITVYPGNFTIEQGTSVIKNFTIRNTGNRTLYNVTLSITGVQWASVITQRIPILYQTYENSFLVNFTLPYSAEIRTYAITATVNTHLTSVYTYKTFLVNATIGEQTVQEEIVPDLNNYTAQLAYLDANLTLLESKGVDTSVARNSLVGARNKLLEAKTLILAKNYGEASRLIREAKGLIEDATLELDALNAGVPLVSPVLILIVAIVIAAVAFFVYLMLPPKEEKKITMFEELEKKKSFFSRPKRNKDAKNK